MRAEVESLAGATGAYDLYGSAQHDPAKAGYRFFPLRCAGDWNRIDGLYMRNRSRPIRDVVMFG